MMARPSSSLLQVLSAMFRYRFAAACPSDPRYFPFCAASPVVAAVRSLLWLPPTVVPLHVHSACVAALPGRAALRPVVVPSLLAVRALQLPLLPLPYTLRRLLLLRARPRARVSLHHSRCRSHCHLHLRLVRHRRLSRAAAGTLANSLPTVRVSPIPPRSVHLPTAFLCA